VSQSLRAVPVAVTERACHHCLTVVPQGRAFRRGSPRADWASHDRGGALSALAGLSLDLTIRCLRGTLRHRMHVRPQRPCEGRNGLPGHPWDVLACLGSRPGCYRTFRRAGPDQSSGTSGPSGCVPFPEDWSSTRKEHTGAGHRERPWKMVSWCVSTKYTGSGPVVGATASPTVARWRQRTPA
jgi:hypothetical protein